MSTLTPPPELEGIEWPPDSYIKKQEVPSVTAIKAFRDHVPHGDLVVWHVCPMCGHDCFKTGWWSYRRGDRPLPLEEEKEEKGGTPCR